MERVKTRILKNIELALTNSQAIGADAQRVRRAGRLAPAVPGARPHQASDPEDVLRVAKAYLKASNRTLGEFIPTKTPDRAEIPATPDDRGALQGLQGRRGRSAGRGVRSDARQYRSRADPRQAAERHEGGAAAQEDPRRHGGGAV